MHLPAQCQLTYGDKTSPELMSLIDKVPKELWGAKLALQVLLMKTWVACTRTLMPVYPLHISSSVSCYRDGLCHHIDPSQ